MDDNTDYGKLIERAQQGDQESLDCLAEKVRIRLCDYVRRLTLREDVTQDIVQETIIEMFKVFEKLQGIERFWDWLYAVAFNKVRRHYGRQWRRKTVSLSGARLK